MTIYTIAFQDKFIIYRPLKKLAFLGNAALVKLIEDSLANKAVPQASQTGEAWNFLQDIGFWEPDPPPPPTPRADAPYQPTVAVLLTTTACNLRCIYCYAWGGQDQVGSLPLAWGQKAIDLACSNAQALGRENFTVGFHGGGEPTLAWDLFRELTQYARSRQIPCQITVASNGIWSPAKREWILQNLDSVSLSLDGLARVQDRQRPAKDGRGTFSRVMDTISALDRKSLPYGIRMTVTDESIADLAAGVEMLCRETACPTFQVEPAFAQGRAKDEQQALTGREAFARAFGEAYEIAAAQGRHLYYSGARPWVLTSRFCQAPQTALIASHDGNISACYEVWCRDHPLARDFSLGRFNGKGNIHLNPEAARSLEAKIEARRRLCIDCFCYWHCAGDCPSKTFSSGGQGHLQFGERCELNRRITKELLLSCLAAGGGLWQGEDEMQREYSFLEVGA